MIRLKFLLVKYHLLILNNSRKK